MIKEELDRKKIAELVRDIRSELNISQRIKALWMTSTKEQMIDFEGYIRDAIRSAIQKTQEILRVLGEYV